MNRNDNSIRVCTLSESSQKDEHDNMVKAHHEEYVYLSCQLRSHSINKQNISIIIISCYYTSVTRCTIVVS